MILKVHSLGRELAQFCQRKNLVTAAVGQDRSIPIHKTVQPAKVSDHIESWPHVQVVGVSQNDLRIELVQFTGAHRLYTSLRPDRQECRCLDDAVSGR